MTTPARNYHQTHADSTRRRVRDAVRVVPVAVRHFSPYPRLYAYRLDLPPGPLYGLDAHREARALVGQTVGTTPAHWKLERGETGGRHLHLTTPLPPRAVTAAGHAARVHDLPGWLAYLSKPADARLCRPGRLTPWTLDPATRARNYRAALDEYCAARRDALACGRRRLSPLSGWLNSPSAHRALPAHLLPALVMLARLSLLACLPVPERVTLPAPARTRPARKTPRRTPARRALRPPLPPPRTQGQAG